MEIFEASFKQVIKNNRHEVDMKKLALLMMFALSFTMLSAQTYNVNPSESEVTITGTSTIHDWESVAEEFTGSAEITVEDGVLTAVEDLTFNVTVKEIESGKGGMNKKIYGALDEKKHPNIVYTLTEINEIDGDTLLATGDLTIAGVTKSIQMKVAYEVLDNGSVTFKGTQPITMTDYKVKPPSAVFGTIKAGDDIEVVFNATFVQ